MKVKQMDRLARLLVKKEAMRARMKKVQDEIGILVDEARDSGLHGFTVPVGEVRIVQVNRAVVNWHQMAVDYVRDAGTLVPEYTRLSTYYKADIVVRERAIKARTVLEA